MQDGQIAPYSMQYGERDTTLRREFLVLRQCGVFFGFRLPRWQPMQWNGDVRPDPRNMQSARRGVMSAKEDL